MSGGKDGYSYKDLYSNINSHWDDPGGRSSSYGKSYYNYDYGYVEPKRKHKFSPILLIYSTVYNCDYCGEKKEDCKTEFCDNKNEDLDYGGWG